MPGSSADLRRDRSRNSNSTESGLLSAAKAGDAAAWRALVDRYSWLVFQWSRNAGLSPHDAADVVQSVLGQVGTYLPGFQKDGASGSFRRWLRTITRTKIADFCRANGEEPQGEGGSAAQQRLLAIPELAESSSAIDQDRTALQRRLWQLIDRLEDEFEDSTWQAFWLTVIENHTTSEAAVQLELSPNAVRTAKWRVLKRLREAAGPLDGDPPKPQASA
ncbi:MAG TPA: sigma-70 family RNA polymerase sigma factor [Planctomycetaceae bacterium]|jgi:RNA polymerase sigma-70 factor (ECF subfamily)|nr:sigma-70 family RNA polymerase sigma factor [Planctomycetaceae bacterium]